jgi:glycosyltransferase 2 family protein
VRWRGDRIGPDTPRWLSWLSRAAPTWPALRVALPAYVGIHIANGIAVACIASATLPVGGTEWALLTGAYALAWMVGFLLPGAPGGLGVRESAFLMLIAPAWPADVAFGIAMLARVANVAADAAIFAAGLVLAGKSGAEAAAPNDL